MNAYWITSNCQSVAINFIVWKIGYRIHRYLNLNSFSMNLNVYCIYSSNSTYMHMNQPQIRLIRRDYSIVTAYYLCFTCRPVSMRPNYLIKCGKRKFAFTCVRSFPQRLSLCSSHSFYFDASYIIHNNTFWGN